MCVLFCIDSLVLFLNVYKLNEFSCIFFEMPVYVIFYQCVCFQWLIGLLNITLELLVLFSCAL